MMNKTKFVLKTFRIKASVAFSTYPRIIYLLLQTVRKPLNGKAKSINFAINFSRTYHELLLENFTKTDSFK